MSILSHIAYICEFEIPYFKAKIYIHSNERQVKSYYVLQAPKNPQDYRMFCGMVNIL